MKAVKKRPGIPDSESDKEAILLRAYGNGTEILIDRESWLSALPPASSLVLPSNPHFYTPGKKIQGQREY